MDKSMMPIINRDQLQSAIKLAVHTNENIMVVGSPGSGKTQISEALAHELSPYVHVATPAVEDQTAATGMPVKVETPDGADVAFIPFKMVKKLVNHDPDAPTFICILDDFGQTLPSVQAAYMQILQDHRVGEHSFPDNVCFILLTNDRSDKSGVQPIFEAVKQRMMSIYRYQLTLDEWIDWAYANDIYPSIPAYLRFKPQAFDDFQPSTELVNQPCARTWHKLSKALNAMHNLSIDNIRQATAIGSVAQYGAEFIEFERYYSKLPDIDALLSGEAEFEHDPEDPAITYALCGTLVHHAEEKNIKRVVRVARSLPKTFQIPLSKDLRSKMPDLIEQDAFTDWCVELLDIFDV